jgi:hypothetical protein
MKTKGLLSWWEIPTREHPWTIYEGYTRPSSSEPHFPLFEPCFASAQGLKGYEAWNPSDPEGKKTAQPIRSLDEN